MFPSPTNDDLKNPGLQWSDQTLYTTGEPVSAFATHRRLVAVIVHIF